MESQYGKRSVNLHCVKTQVARGLRSMSENIWSSESGASEVSEPDCSDSRPVGFLDPAEAVGSVVHIPTEALKTRYHEESAPPTLVNPLIIHFHVFLAYLVLTVCVFVNTPGRPRLTRTLVISRLVRGGNIVVVLTQCGARISVRLYCPKPLRRLWLDSYCTAATVQKGKERAGKTYLELDYKSLVAMSGTLEDKRSLRKGVDGMSVVGADEGPHWPVATPMALTLKDNLSERERKKPRANLNGTVDNVTLTRSTVSAVRLDESIDWQLVNLGSWITSECAPSPRLDDSRARVMAAAFMAAVTGLRQERERLDDLGHSSKRAERESARTNAEPSQKAQAISLWGV
ncbi:hypothetical protein C8F01DRAFT_1329156 [Mycena amicta]|nr:hypothetical protein C8F01DRAFT_1329156 [Mycena amicta]